MTITGTSGQNNKTATNNADNIAASANRDVVNAKGGPDRIFGDGGNDTLDCGAGRDHIEGGDGDNVARGNDGDGDWVSVVDNDTNDFVSGGDGTEDVCIVDLVNGVRDDFSDTCEKVYQTASIPQEEPKSSLRAYGAAHTACVLRGSGLYPRDIPIVLALTHRSLRWLRRSREAFRGSR